MVPKQQHLTISRHASPCGGFLFQGLRKAFEALGVEPVFPKKDQAIDYAQNRACFRSGENRVLDSTGNIERTVAFSEANRKL